MTNNEIVDVFLSRPTWVPAEYADGLATFETHLSNLGIRPRTVGVSDYPSQSPLDEVIALLAKCRGAIILGLPQIEVQSATVKGVSVERAFALGTEWNHLEAGLAHAAGLPILVIHHTTVCRGIFDRGVLNAFLHAEDLRHNSWSMQKHINGALESWKKRCLESVTRHE